jgi:hypothetical protein
VANKSLQDRLPQQISAQYAPGELLRGVDDFEDCASRSATPGSESKCLFPVEFVHYYGYPNSKELNGDKR